MKFRTGRRALAVALTVAGLGLVAGLSPQATAAGECETPTIAAEPAFTAGTSNTISWTTTDATLTDFVVQVGSGAFDPATGLAVVDSTIPVTGNSVTINSLSSGAHSYTVQAAEVAAVCTASFWATPVSSSQDNTDPVLTVTEPSRSLPVALVNSPEGVVTFSGTLTDIGGSGGSLVYIEIHNTTAQAVIGGSCGAGFINDEGLCPGQSGTATVTASNWTKSFTLNPGTYEAVILGYDGVGNDVGAFVGFTVLPDVA